jgi:hypothetical protein
MHGTGFLRSSSRVIVYDPREVNGWAGSILDLRHRVRGVLVERLAEAALADVTGRRGAGALDAFPTPSVGFG